MKIGIDISSLIYQRGVSRYTSNLVHGLLELRDVELSLYGSSMRNKIKLEVLIEDILDSAANSSKHNIKIQSWPPSLLSLIWKFGQNKIENVLPNIDVFHSWDWIQPPDKNIPIVSTIHDLAILKFPQTAHPKILKMHQQSWKKLLEHKAEIIAVSHATKKDVIELLGFPSWKVHVIPEALPLETVKATDSLTEEDYQTIKNKLQLNKPFIFFVGTREPRKNLANLIKAWEPLSDKFQLIIAGETGWDNTDQSENQSTDLRFLGRVSDQELSVLYGEALAFVYPSLYEGFGLPILESFYHGTPVVTSNVPALVEVAGNAAELVDPTSIENIRSGINKVINETDIDQKKRMQRMIIRLQMFDWQRVAKDTLKVYHKAIENFQD